jgi:hypothetical protein
MRVATTVSSVGTSPVAATVAMVKGSTAVIQIRPPASAAVDNIRVKATVAIQLLLLMLTSDGSVAALFASGACNSANAGWGPANAAGPARVYGPDRPS